MDKLYKKCFKHVVPRYTPEDGVGLYAKEGISKDTVVLEIPLQGMITIDNLLASQSDEVSQLICDLNIEQDQQFIMFSVLLHLEGQKTDGLWYSYMKDLWPAREEMNNSILWSDAKVKALSKSNYIAE